MDFGRGLRNYITAIVIGLVIVNILSYFFSDVLPFDITHYFTMPSEGAFWAMIPVLLWGIAFQSIISMVSPPKNVSPSEVFYAGIGISLYAGITEELTFRWVFWLTSMFSLCFVNWLTFGFVHWIFVDGLIPLTNWLTMGYMSHHLIDIANTPYWYVAGAIVLTNWNFKRAHRYMDWYGYINSWFVGMFLFYTMLTYGLVAAIICHILYDFVVFTTCSLWIRPKYQ